MKGFLLFVYTYLPLSVTDADGPAVSLTLAQNFFEIFKVKSILVNLQLQNTTT